MAGQKNPTAAIKEYFAATRRPLYSIVIAAPFFVAYELGIAFLLPQQPPDARLYIRAATILQGLSSVAGRHAAYLLPVLLGIGLLLYMDWRERRERRRRSESPLGFQPAFVGWMFAEGLVLALPLHLVLPEISRMFAAASGAGAGPRGSLLFQLTTVCGAGAYEELLFRLFLFSGLYWVGRQCRLEKAPSGILAAVAAGAIFALFHKQGQPWNAQFQPAFLFFATLAGVYFSAICLYRSFGMAVATHASYDIMAVLLLTFARS